MADDKGNGGQGSDGKAKKRLVLGEEARKAAIDSAAATLAAIHTAKQVSAEVQSSQAATGAPGLPFGDFRIPMGDILFGAAQIQVEFARKLFEYNKATAKLVRERIRDRLESQRPRAKKYWTVSNADPKEQLLTITNTASLSKTFELSADVVSSDGKKISETVFRPNPITIGAGKPGDVKVTFDPPLKTIGTYTGHVAVTRAGIQIELLPFEITVT